MFELDEVYGMGLSVDTWVTGVDEVGRGPLAGPVTSCAVSCSLDQLQQLYPYFQELGVTDSKKLSHKKRLAILDQLEIKLAELVAEKQYQLEIKGVTLYFCLAEKDHEQIDQLNILRASLEAMADACEKNLSTLDPKEGSHIFIDGNKLISKRDRWTKTPCLGDASLQTVVKGDSRSVIIALASIIAKEYRDAYMQEQGKLYPGYGLENHAGYPTPSHKEAIAKQGPSPIHRKSFKGVREYLH
jgi:ribonuclease HII